MGRGAVAAKGGGTGLLEGGEDVFGAEDVGERRPHGEGEGGGVEAVEGAVGAGGAADEGMEEAAAVAPAVLQTDDQVGGLVDEAVKGLPEAMKGVGVFAAGGGGEECAVVDKAGVIDVSGALELGNDGEEVEGVTEFSLVAVAAVGVFDGGAVGEGAEDDAVVLGIAGKADGGVGK